MKLTPYQKIIRACIRGTGVRLSAKDVQDMSMNTTIIDIAAEDDAAEQLHQADADPRLAIDPVIDEE